MPTERANVDFPLWRKKVDRSLFEHNATPIPLWAWQMWRLEEFESCHSKTNEKSKVLIRFEKKNYAGWITVTKKKSDRRLFFDEDLSHSLKHAFLMSYMRSIEGSICKEKNVDIEKRIPFWEFIDIEYEREDKSFRFVAHYRQEPSFPHLFSRLIDSPGLKKVAESVKGDNKPRIEKQNWISRDEFPSQIGAKNVIYQLLDSRKQLIYIGETIDLIKAILPSRNGITFVTAYFQMS